MRFVSRWATAALEERRSASVWQGSAVEETRARHYNNRGPRNTTNATDGLIPAAASEYQFATRRASNGVLLSTEGAGATLLAEASWKQEQHGLRTRL